MDLSIFIGQLWFIGLVYPTALHVASPGIFGPKTRRSVWSMRQWFPNARLLLPAVDEWQSFHWCLVESEEWWQNGKFFLKTTWSEGPFLLTICLSGIFRLECKTTLKRILPPHTVISPKKKLLRERKRKKKREKKARKTDRLFKETEQLVSGADSWHPLDQWYLVNFLRDGNAYICAVQCGSR